ncbi:SDR family NAD(P)-dependent oxidoreductase [Promicromonospora kroppenstedtii]|uniref:SDR family NAD(P)-dependent oxidoreductase n=1 Tax=Promicromonospora kroppenstedtii TaxID=440482 RepID=UPI0004BA9CB0|nr:SDR family NAD(P)-dependent oxidoreductase [Promicromonospora kroppenstedtii]
MTSAHQPITWFVTGASRGLGAHWVKAALDRGDRVAATSRSISTLDHLVETYGDRALPLQLDVSDAAAVDQAVRTAEERFGGIDVLVNNAGHALMGAVEEVSPEQARAQYDVNFFGPLWTSRAVLPGMRARGNGRIIQVSSYGGLVAYPTMGLYHSSKWALEAMSQALAGEVAGHGIHVTLVEPLTFATDLGTSAPAVKPMPVYDGVRAALMAGMQDSPFVTGDPAATADALLAIADAPNPPLRVLFGSNGIKTLRAEYDRRIDELEKWDHISQLAQGDAVPE